MTERKIIADIINELEPIEDNSNSENILDLIIESVMLNHAVYSKATFLIATGRKNTSKQNCITIVKKEIALDKLNRDLQAYAKKELQPQLPLK